MVIANSQDQKIELQNYLQRLTDATDPQPANIVELRIEERLSRTLPTLVAPWGENGPAIDQAMFVVTKNLSATGVSLISQTGIETENLLMVLLNQSEFRFLKGLVRYRRPIDGGFVQVGVELERIVDPCEFPKLLQLAKLIARLNRS
ncbi:hypothetical protein CA54_15540 [Symmachiella macrocystis]|uniref:PilZ domain-containing protein n=2 Tax=Symmachiella macrocystis TaxID=2527985 RepID=A0A5C6BNV2_9PLAN|nr:hypothetical protein CA54_15540 [Symmachiella macrocystis]